MKRRRGDRGLIRCGDRPNGPGIVIGDDQRDVGTTNKDGEGTLGRGCDGGLSRRIWYNRERILNCNCGGELHRGRVPG